jgi:hypothetical protein
MRLSCRAPPTYDSAPPIGPSCSSRSFKASQIVVRRFGRDCIGHRLGVASGGLQELEHLFEALPDHLRIVSSAYGKACMPGCRDRQSAERLCVAARS